MSEPTLEALFERYRAQGELEALGAVFDRTAPELLALAAHLVRDPVEAEDLVQTTFVAAIEGARSFEGGRRLEPWLAGILARQAARAHRERGRTPDPRRLEREGEADPLEHAERRELGAALARGLDELSAPYREVLERYLAGEKPLAIARASGRAPGAVRMQILRALEKLRRALPAGLYGVVPLARAPRGLAALRVEIVARGGLALAAGSAAVGSSVIGGVLVSTKVVLSVVVAAAALALVFLLRAPRESVPHEPVARAESVPPAAAPAELADATSAGRAMERVPASDAALAHEPAGPTAAAPSESASRAGVFLVGALLGLDALDPTQVEIGVRAQGSSVAGRGGADGRYALEVTPLMHSPEGTPSALYLDAVHPAGRKTSLEFALDDAARQADPRVRTELRLDLDLEARTMIVGRVQACAGVEAGSVYVALVVPEAGGELSWEPVDETQCDEHGVFRFFPRSAGEYTVVARAWGVPPVARSVAVAEREVADAGVLALAPGGVALEGVVRVPFEAHVERWQVRAVRVEPSPGERAGSWQGVSFASERLAVTEGLAKPTTVGAFRVEGLEPGTYTLQLEQEGGDEFVLPYAALQVNAPAAGVVLGESYGRTRVSVSCAGGEAREIQLESRCDEGRIHSRGGFRCGGSAVVIADRRMPFSLSAFAPGWKRATSELPPSRAIEEQVELVLEPNDELAALALSWTPTPGLAPPDAVTAHWRRGEESGESTTRTTEGGCRFESWLPGRYRVTLEPRGEDFWEPNASRLCTEPFEVELVARGTAHASVAWTAGGRARFTPDASRRPPEFYSLEAKVVDTDGRSLAVRFTQRSYEDGGIRIGSWTGGMALRGVTDLQPNLPPGGYELVLAENGAELLRVPFTIVAGETVEVPFVVP